MEDKLFGEDIIGLSFDIGINPRFNTMIKVKISPSGTRFVVFDGDSMKYTYELHPILTEKLKLKFELICPFESNQLFDCNENLTLNILGYIFEREKRFLDEIS